MLFVHIAQHGWEKLGAEPLVLWFEEVASVLVEIFLTSDVAMSVCYSRHLHKLSIRRVIQESLTSPQSFLLPMLLL